MKIDQSSMLAVSSRGNEINMAALLHETREATYKGFLQGAYLIMWAIQVLITKGCDCINDYWE